MTPSDHAFIFDLDGTLIDSLDDITAAMNVALDAFGEPRATREQVRSWIGDGVGELCRRAAPKAPQAQITDMEKTLINQYRNGCLDRTRPYDGIVEVIESLRRRGAILAVLSNKPDEFTRLIVERLFPRGCFRAVRGVRDPAERKPSPAGALALARELCLGGKKIFFVGDSRTDIQTARAAGMIAVAVTWGFRDEAELRDAQPDFLVHHVRDLVALIAPNDRVVDTRAAR